MTLDEKLAKFQSRQAEFELTAQSSSLQLRLDLSSLLRKAIDKTGLTQRELAVASGKRESFVSRVMHSDANCTFKVAATLLHAAGIKPKLVDCEEWERLKKLDRAGTCLSAALPFNITNGPLGVVHVRADEQSTRKRSRDRGISGRDYRVYLTVVVHFEGEGG